MGVFGCAFSLSHPRRRILVAVSTEKGSMFSLGNISHKIFNERFTMNTKFIHDLPGIILIVYSIFENDVLPFLGSNFVSICF